MTKHIHIHVHRAATQDSSDWDEAKHKRADNGQFGSGGGGAKKPAAKKSEGGAKKSEATAQGEVGSSEKEKYGVYFKKGDTVRLPGGKTAEVVSHVGPSVETTAGNFHPTKIEAAPRRLNPYNVSVQLAGRKEQLAELQKDMKTGKYSPEDMVELKSREAQLKRVIKKYEEASGGTPVSFQQRVEQTRQDQLARAARESLGVKSKEDHLRDYETAKAQYAKVLQRLNSPYQTPAQRKALTAERDKLKIKLGRAMTALTPEQKAAKRIP